jgi:hypothetical protein
VPVDGDIWPDRPGVEAEGAFVEGALVEGELVEGALVEGVVAALPAAAAASVSADSGTAPAGVAPAGDAEVGSAGSPAAGAVVGAAPAAAGTALSPDGVGAGVGTVVWATMAAAARLASEVGAAAVVLWSALAESLSDPAVALLAEFLGAALVAGVAAAAGTPDGWLSDASEDDGAAALEEGLLAEDCAALAGAGDGAALLLADGAGAGVRAGAETVGAGVAVTGANDGAVAVGAAAGLGTGAGVGTVVVGWSGVGVVSAELLESSSSEKKAPLPREVEDAVPAPVISAVMVLFFWAALVSDSTVMSCLPKPSPDYLGKCYLSKPRATRRALGSPGAPHATPLPRGKFCRARPATNARLSSTVPRSGPGPS